MKLPLLHDRRGNPPDYRRAASAVIFTVLAVFATYIPSDAYLARSDLLPWVALSTSLAVLLFGGPISEGHHPQLTPLHTLDGWAARRLATALVPWVALRLTDAIILASRRNGPDGDLVAAHQATAEVQTLLLACVVCALVFYSRHEGRTAWRPDRAWTWTVIQVALFVTWLTVHVVVSVWYLDIYTVVLYPSVIEPIDRALHAALAVPVHALLAVVGIDAGPVAAAQALTVEQLRDSAVVHRELVLSGSIACGGFGGAALLWERGQNIRQRARAGRRGWSVLGRVVLVFMVPPIGIALCRGVLDYAEVFEAYAITAWFLLAGGILWPRPASRGYGVLLHGLVPRSLVAVEPADGTSPVSAPPRGTLRFNPAHVSRTGLSIPWIVYRDQSAAAGLVGDLDRLWPEWRARPDRHVLGGVSAWALRDGRPVLEISVRTREDVAPLLDGDNQDRGLAVYHPPDSPARHDALDEATWRWEAPEAEARLIQVDPSTTDIRLGDGSVLIFSTGYLTHLFEVEICDAISPSEMGALLHPPQLQDHVTP